MERFYYWFGHVIATRGRLTEGGVCYYDYWKKYSLWPFWIWEDCRGTWLYMFNHMLYVW